MLEIQRLRVFPGETEQSSGTSWKPTVGIPTFFPLHPLFRELLTDHRVPGLLLEAMKVAVKKQRKKIKAKMLGTAEEAESSDDEDDSWLLLSNDKEEAPLVPGSRIQNLYVGGGEVRRRVKEGPAWFFSTLFSCSTAFHAALCLLSCIFALSTFSFL